MSNSVRIVSQGIGWGTRVFDSETGIELKMVRSVEIAPIELNDLVSAKVEFVIPELDITTGDCKRLFNLYPRPNINIRPKPKVGRPHFGHFSVKGKISQMSMLKKQAESVLKMVETYRKREGIEFSA